MNPFTAHTAAGSHLYRTLVLCHGHCYRLLTSVVAFAAHAILPFIPIKPEYDLEVTVAYLNERNNWIKSAKNATHSIVSTDFIPASRKENRV